MGIAGLVVLLMVVLMALFAPLLIDPSGLDVTQAEARSCSPPSWAYPFGTDDPGRSVLTLEIWGSRISLLVGLLAAVVSWSSARRSGSSRATWRERGTRC